MRFNQQDYFSTYSIVARNPDTGDLGVAVQTHQMYVGSVVPWLQKETGAIASQAWFNYQFGPIGLKMLQEGIDAPTVVQALITTDPNRDLRQLAVVDCHGQAAAFTGKRCLRHAGHHIGAGYSVQANMMTNATVIDAMRTAFESATGDLAAGMLAALQAAQAQGGDIRGMQSAALKIIPGASNPLFNNRPVWAPSYDLRVDEHADPIQELSRLVRLRHAELIDKQGEQALAQGDTATALAHWAEARRQAPELEELPFWQAVSLATDGGDVWTAQQILRQAFATDPRRAHWRDLLARLVEVELMLDAALAAQLAQALTD